MNWRKIENELVEYFRDIEGWYTEADGDKFTCRCDAMLTDEDDPRCGGVPSKCERAINLTVLAHRLARELVPA